MVPKVLPVMMVPLARLVLLAQTVLKALPVMMVPLVQLVR